MNHDLKDRTSVQLKNQQSIYRTAKQLCKLISTGIAASFMLMLIFIRRKLWSGNQNRYYMHIGE